MLSLQEKTSESCFWASNTLVQNSCSFKFFRILEENCGADIISGKFKCETFVKNGVKNCRWVSYTFLQKPCSSKFFSILEENCGADIINGTFNCQMFVQNW